MSRKNLVLQIWGKKGVKNGGFVIFSKTSVKNWFHLPEKEDIIILHMCAKLQVQVIFCSRDRGLNGVKRGQKGVKMGFFGILRKTS